MRFVFELWQDGIKVAGVDAPNREDGLREIDHYAMVYGQDGPVEIRDKSKAEKREQGK